MKINPTTQAKVLTAWCEKKSHDEIDRAIRTLVKDAFCRGTMKSMERLTQSLKRTMASRGGQQKVSIRHAGRWTEMELRTLLTQLLYSKNKREVYEIQATVDDSLLGGVEITMGDRRITANLNARLNALRSALINSPS